MSASFEGKVGLVTGGASGIGAAVATRLAQSGARVVIADLNGDAAAAHAASLPSGSAVGIAADVSVEADVQTCIATALQSFGGLDVVHNNAGITGPAKHLVEIEVEDFDRVLAVNARGVFLVLREACRHFTEQGKPGAIVNTSSAAGLRGYRMRTPYSASKHAVVGLTKVAALEGALSGIRVNAVCPGPIETAFISSVALEWGSGDIDKGRAEMSESVPMRRLGTPLEASALICWLLSDEASFMTGAIVPIDGGRTAY
jgi:NAD(P)-dependent dehydrogenase (short-subunit alcohol dehydrogenase family)